MKKVLISLFVLISLLLTGCQETSVSNSISNSNGSSEVVDSSVSDESSTTSESVNRKKLIINFKFGEFSSMVEIDKGTIISEDIIPFVQNINIKLYYDEEFLNEYNNEEIYKNIDIYIKFIDEVNLDMIDKVFKAYFNTYIKPKREDAIIEDVILFEYLGTYNGVFVGVFLDKKDCLFIEKECEIIVEDIVFRYSYGYDIRVYDGSVFMDLLTAYNNSKLTYEDLLSIYKLH